MSYKVRVTLSGIKGFFRVYQINGESTLYTLHKQMRSDMEFPQDQLILFKALGADGQVLARYGLFDLGDGAVDDVTMAAAVKKGIASFVYFYDVTSKKSVNVTIEEEVPGSVSSTSIIDSKGPNPIDFENGYVAFEDLPDDKRHLPGEGPEKKKSKLADIFNIDLDNLDDEDDDDDEDDEDEDDEKDEDTEEIYDEDEGAL